MFLQSIGRMRLPPLFNKSKIGVERAFINIINYELLLSKNFSLL